MSKWLFGVALLVAAVACEIPPDPVIGHWILYDVHQSSVELTLHENGDAIWKSDSVSQSGIASGKWERDGERLVISITHAGGRRLDPPFQMELTITVSTENLLCLRNDKIPEEGGEPAEICLTKEAGS